MVDRVWTVALEGHRLRIAFDDYAETYELHGAVEDDSEIVLRLADFFMRGA